MSQKIQISEILEPENPIRIGITESGIEEMKDSLVKRGQINAITIRPKNGKYEITTGHRRFIAAKELGWEKINAEIKDSNEEETRLIRAHENLIREDMTAIEEAELVEIMMKEENDMIEVVSKKIGKSRDWIDKRLDILRWDPEIQKAIEKKEISIEAAKHLARVTDETQRRWLLRMAIESGATARTTAAWLQAWMITGIVPDPTNVDYINRGDHAAPLQPTLPCFGCKQQFALPDLRHQWFCSDCFTSLYIALEEAEQRERNEGEK